VTQADETQQLWLDYRRSGAAIDSYDPAQDAEFEKYAMARIKAQVLDELCSRDWTT
jgi:hypothetical protein